MDLNAVQYNASTRAGHVESYFLKANDPAGERAIWIRATIFASTREPDRPMAEGWAIAFDRRGGSARHVAVKHSLRFEAASFDARDLRIGWLLSAPRAPSLRGGSGGGDDAPRSTRFPRGDDAPRSTRFARSDDAPAPRSTRFMSSDELSITPGASHGRISLREHRITWDLRFTAGASPIVPFPFEAMYRAPFPRMKLCTPNPDARFDGEITVDGERWTAAGWRGMQGHNWGRAHADSYAWCHANVWNEDDDFVLEGLSARLRVGPVRAPLATLVCVRHRGIAYDFNGPLDVIRATGDIGRRSWDFSAANGRARIEGTVEADAGDFVGLYYPNPDGPMTYCLNTKLARARVRFTPAGGSPIALTSSAAAVEIGTRDDAHGVRMYV